MTEIETIVLFDMDDTLFDHNGQLLRDLERISSPSEPKITESELFHVPHYIKKKLIEIRKTKSWWANLPKFQLGWDIWDIAGELGYRREILTKANLKNPSMWMGKVECIIKNISDKTPLTITSASKSRYRGRVLVDDYPLYCSEWLDRNQKGSAIMPAHTYNSDFSHPRLTRYDGQNLEQIREVLIRARDQN
jgi:hypothetical protein